MFIAELFCIEKLKLIFFLKVYYSVSVEKIDLNFKKNFLHLRKF